MNAEYSHCEYNCIDVLGLLRFFLVCPSKEGEALFTSLPIRPNSPAPMSFHWFFMASTCRSSLLSAVLIAWCGTPCFASTPGSPPKLSPPFFDDFNRPDSVSVGNGWIEGTNKQHLSIQSGQLSQAGTISRPMDTTQPLTVKFDLDDDSTKPAYSASVGIRSVPMQPTSGFTVRIAWDPFKPYYAVQLTDNGSWRGVQRPQTPFNGPLGVSVTFYPDGSISGTIRKKSASSTLNPSETFSFSFPKQVINSAGDQISLSLFSSRSTIDNVSLSPTDAATKPNLVMRKAGPLRLRTAPALGDDGTFYVSASANTSSVCGLAAFRSDTAEVLWGPLDGHSQLGDLGQRGVAISRSGIIHAGRNSAISAFLPDGSALWETPRQATAGENSYLPLLDDDNDYIFDAGFDLVTHNGTTGTRLADEIIGGFNGPILGGAIDTTGTVVFGLGTNNTTRITASGRWNKVLADRMLHVRAIGVEDRIYVYDSLLNHLACCDADGTELWRRSNLDRPVIAASGEVFAGAVQGNYIECLALNGDVLWKSELPAAPKSPSVAVDFLDAAGYVYGRFGSSLYCLDRFDGAVIWSYKALNSLYERAATDEKASPRIGNRGRLFFTDTTNQWYLLDTQLTYAQSPWPIAIHGNLRNTRQVSQDLAIPNVISPALAGLSTATAITHQSAKLEAMIRPGSYPTAVFIEWGSTKEYKSRTDSVVLAAGDDPVPFSRTLEKLLRGTTYHFRVVATNESGTVQSADTTFQTKPNTPPKLMDDFVYGIPGIPLRIAVLENDEDAEGDNLSIMSVAPPANAEIAIHNDGSILWTAKSDDVTTSTFGYTAADGFGGAASASVTVINPFVKAGGTYFGTISSTTSSGLHNGTIRLAVNGKGAFTGRISFGGGGSNASGYPIRGNFDPDGVSVQNLVILRGSTAIRINLYCDFTVAPICVTGTVTNGSTNLDLANILAEQIPWAPQNPTPHAGHYTLLLQRPPDQAVGLPYGTGFARMQVRKGGQCFLIGRLGDSTPFTLSSHVQMRGTFPLYTGLYRAYGSDHPSSGGLFGILQFQDIPGQSDGDGVCQWERPLLAGRIIPSAFRLSIPVIVSRFSAPKANGYVIAPHQKNESNARITLEREDFESDIHEPSTLHPITSRTGSKLVLPIHSLNALQIQSYILPHAGYLNGTLQPRPDGTVTKIRGIAFQKQRILAGVFGGIENPGAIMVKAAE